MLHLKFASLSVRLSVCLSVHPTVDLTSKFWLILSRVYISYIIQFRMAGGLEFS